ncbi:MAG: TfoX/Sxy family protein [Flavobacteriales bacterium]
MNESLAQRLRDQLIARKIKNEEKKMFGGICFMVRGSMSVGITNKGEFMVRIDPDEQTTALKKKGARIMDFTGKPMKGFLFISEEGFVKDTDLESWVDMAMRYNVMLPEKTKEPKRPAVKKSKK